MNKNILLEFIKKHTDEIEKCRWVSDAKNKTLKVNVVSDTKNLLCDLTLNKWDGFGDAEVGIGNLSKFKKELSGLYDDDITCELKYNDDKSRIISVDIMDGGSVAVIVTSDLDMISPSSKLKVMPPISAEIIFDTELKERFFKAKAALPDVKTFTVMMNKKGVLELVIGYSNINSSKFALKVKTSPGKDTVSEPLHFRADYLTQILSANSECGDVILKVSDNGLCALEFNSENFDCKYYLTVTEDQD